MDALRCAFERFQACLHNYSTSIDVFLSSTEISWDKQEHFHHLSFYDQYYVPLNSNGRTIDIPLCVLLHSPCLSRYFSSALDTNWLTNIIWWVGLLLIIIFFFLHFVQLLSFSNKQFYFITLPCNEKDVHHHNSSFVWPDFYMRISKNIFFFLYKNEINFIATISQP